MKGKKGKRGPAPGSGPLRFKTNSPEETFRLAEKLGHQLKRGTVVALTGEIGSGKTVFIKGLCRGLGVKDSGEVKSPTFVLLRFYQGRIPIQHFDLYRLERESELDLVGFDDFVSAPGVVSIVEWADRAPGRIPKNAFSIQMQVGGAHARRIVISKGGRPLLRL